MFYLGTKLLAYISRKVAINDQLFISYSLDISESANTAQRRRQLQSRFFDCECEKCTSRIQITDAHRNAANQKSIMELEQELQQHQAEWNPEYGAKVDAYLRKIADPSYIH